MTQLYRRIANAGLAYLALCAQCTWAVEVPITASFHIDPTGGLNQSFKNTTPISGYCKLWPNYCPPGAFSVTTGLNITKTWSATDDLGDGLMISIPGEFREVDVRNVSNETELHRLKFRINAHSLRAERVGGSGMGFHHFKSGQLSYPAGPCTHLVNAISDGSTFVQTIWGVPARSSVCHAQFVHGNPYNVRYIPTLGYELIAPNPLLMHAGTYRGEIRYSVGPGQDFDYYNTAEYSSNEIIFKFELTVEHMLKVDFPGAAAGRPVVAQLEPRGGWQAWQGGRMPPRVERDVPFRFSMSGPVSVHMTCGQPMGASCGIADASDSIPLDVRISIPGASNARAGTAVDHIPLPIGPAAAITLGVGAGSLQGVPATIHITSPGPFKPATTYEGQITLVFDADA